MNKGTGMFEKSGKESFRCLKDFASDPEEYGIDFIKNNIYYGQKEDNEYYYLDSTENGTCVLISNRELYDNFYHIPAITDKTIMIDECCQKVIAACKKAGNYLDALKECVVEITGSELKYIGYHAMYHWIAETYKQIGKTNLFKVVLDRIFEPEVWDQYTNCEERILIAMCAELCTLQINDHDEQGQLVALIDMSKV
jgi:hypothetical protein